MKTISYEDFISGSLEFLALSQKLADGWEAKGDAQKEGGFYLVKLQCIEDALQDSSLEETNESNIKLDAEESLEDNQCSNDPSTVDINCKRVITYEYHITYSLSFSVPVLYFNAYYTSGQLLTLEEVWKRVDLQHSEQIIHRRWESLTQQEHPVLGRPFFQLHPCHTSKIMDDVSTNCKDLESFRGKKYITSWLSMFGPVVGLKLPIQYFQN